MCENQETLLAHKIVEPYPQLNRRYLQRLKNSKQFGKVTINYFYKRLISRSFKIC